MAIRDTILTLKNKEGTLTNNKVCNFAYDDTAYADDTTAGANGVVNYNYNNHNNIPVKDNAVIKVNPTITSKGFRSQVSTLPRMLLNHIFGRVSYNLNKTVDTFNATLQALYGAIGQANGIASLDNTGRLPYSQLPLSAVEYKGAWNADTNTPALSSGSGTFGDEYIVSVQGTQNLGEGSVTYRVGDRVIYNGSVWQRIPSSSVRSVNTKTPDANGNVTINAGDIVTPDVYGLDRANAGKYWIKSSTTISVLHPVYANGIWIAHSFNSPKMYWSEDGKSWNEGLGTSSATNVTYCYYAHGMFFACSNVDMYWSLDGKNWNPSNNAQGIGFSHIYYADGMFVATTYATNGTYHGVYWSTDGKTWTQGTSQETYGDIQLTSCVEVCYANGVWVVGASASASNHFQGIWYSTDGKVWHRWIAGASPVITRLVLYANGIWVASGGSYTFWSNDGITWTSAEIIHASASTANNVLYFANGTWVLIQEQIFTSSDGKAWTVLSGLQGNGVGVAWKNNLWVIGTSQKLYYSSDLITWTPCTIETTPRVGFFVYNVNSLWLTSNYNYAELRESFYSEGTLTNNVKTILDWLIYAVDNMLD